MSNKYIVNSDIPRWSFLNGYTCNSVDKDHVLRHLGYRFKSLCSMYALNNSYAQGEIGIHLMKELSIDITAHKKPNIVDEYWNDYGYVLEINNGSCENEEIEKMLFVNDTEANEWQMSINAWITYSIIE